MKNLITKRLTAFTLAETLIVMAVIGVVAALTLPNLNSSTSNKEKVAKVKKIYQNLNDAFGRAEAVYGPIDTWFTNTSCIDFGNATNKPCSKRLAERITEFMKLSKICEFDQTGCFSNNTYKTRDGDSTVLNPKISYKYKILTADGTSLSFELTGKNCSYNERLEGECAIIGIDIDGPTKGPSIRGIDTFYFYFTKNGIAFIDYEPRLNDLFQKGIYADSWIIKNENMDYLKADSSGKCPNGTQLSETVTSCN